MKQASVAIRRARRVTGVNVFTQKKMKGIRCRIGSEQYKQKQSEIYEEWSRLSEAERAVYEKTAAEQSADRSKAATVTLAQDGGQEFALCPGLIHFQTALISCFITLVSPFGQTHTIVISFYSNSV